MSKRKLFITCKEFGRGKATYIRCKNLQNAQEKVKAYWQGPEYIDGDNSFHNDYATFQTHGFSLTELGKRTPTFCDGQFDFFTWTWFNLNEKETQNDS